MNEKAKEEKSEIKTEVSSKEVDLKKMHELRLQLAELEERIGMEPLAPEDKVWVKINTAPYSQVLQINSQQFFHGHSYEVDQGTAAMLHEMMRRTWAHEDAIHGANENSLRRQTNRVLNGALR